MILLCIDPGTDVSGVVYIDTDTMNVLEAYGEINNWDLLSLLSIHGADHLAIEMIASYGMAVGKDTFETCVWIGRFVHAFNAATHGENHTFVYRKDVKMYLCGSMRAKDSNVNRALKDLYPETGGGKNPQVGTKNNPGPLYGIKKHAWSALAVGHAWVSLQAALAACRG